MLKIYNSSFLPLKNALIIFNINQVNTIKVELPNQPGAMALKVSKKKKRHLPTGLQ